jgi:hypothetical protein
VTRSLASILLLFALPASAGLYTVTTFDDSGPGSLREAILAANSGACPDPCIISFQRNIFTFIDLRSPLPAITASNVRISPGDSEFGGQVRIVVRGSAAGPNADGLRIEGARNVRVNTIGFDGFSGNGVVVTRSLEPVISVRVTNNGGDGLVIRDSQSVRVRSVIAGGNRGHGIHAAGSRSLEITGCLIGIGDDFDRHPNGRNGIHVFGVTMSDLSFNTIHYNAANGIVVLGSANGIEYNRFLGNGLLGIDVGDDGVSAATAPVIETATYNRGFVRVTGRVRSTPNARVRIQLYRTEAPDPSGYGEGEEVVHPFESFEQLHVGTDANGEARFVFHLPNRTASGELRESYLTALATLVIDGGGRGETSEFGPAVKVADDEVVIGVTSTADSGGGSLRDAIEEANARAECSVLYPCVIGFRISALPPQSGVFTIRPKSPLPALRRSGVWLDGATQREFAGDSNPSGPEIEINGAECPECNGLEVHPAAERSEQILIRDVVINGFAGHGILVSASDLGTSVVAYVDGSYVGTDPTGTRAVPNGGSGIHVENAFAQIGAWREVIGRQSSGNLIGGNGGDGISLQSGGFIAAFGNLIGTDVTTLYPIPNRNGIRTEAGSRLEGNIVAFNRAAGIVVARPGNGVNQVFPNAIHSNGGLGVDIGDEATQKAPEIHSARSAGDQTFIRFRLDSPRLTGCCAAYLVTIHGGSFADASGRGEGKYVFASKLVEGGNDEVEIVLNTNLAGKFVAATAMKIERFGNVGLDTTSEFSPAVQVTSDICSPDAPAIGEAEVGGRVRLTWSAVPGTLVYIVWSMRPGDMPRRLFEGTSTEATVALESGRYEWWVESRFENCYGAQSEHRFLTVP